MSQPLWQVRHVATEENLPEKLKRGVAYFVQDQQYIIVDMGDGRGPVKYGDKPGPAGISGEPQPHLQEQLDTLAHASLQHTITMYNLARSTQTYMRQIEQLVALNFEFLKEQDSLNAEAILTAMKQLHQKCMDYDAALVIMAKNIAELYPHDWGMDKDEPSSSTDDEGKTDKPDEGQEGHEETKPAPLEEGEVLLNGGNLYRIDKIESDGDAGTVVLTLYDTAVADTLEVGDTVEMAEGFFTVDSVNKSPDGNSITITIHQS